MIGYGKQLRAYIQRQARTEGTDLHDASFVTEGWHERMLEFGGYGETRMDRGPSTVEHIEGEIADLRLIQSAIRRWSGMPEDGEKTD